MKFKNLIFALLLYIIAFNIKAQCPPFTNSLTSFFNNNNGQSGIMFDVRAISSSNITCFDISMDAGQTHTFEIYTRPNTHVGFEDDATAWTLIGTLANVTSAGNDVPTSLPIPVNISIPAGESAAFYITSSTGSTFNYTNGIAVGDVLADDANIELLEGTGKAYPFGTSFRSRQFNGTVYYTPAVVSVPSPEIPEYTPILTGTADYSKGHLEWSRPIDTTGILPTIQEFEVYITEDGGITYTLAALTDDYYTSLNLINGIEYGFRVRPIYVIQGGNNYLSGNYSNVIYLHPSIILGTEEKLNSNISLYPNPSEGNFTLKFEDLISQKATIKVTDLTGKVILTQNLDIINGNSSHAISLPNTAAGMYIVQIETEKGIYQQKISIVK